MDNIFNYINKTDIDNISKKYSSNERFLHEEKTAENSLLLYNAVNKAYGREEEKNLLYCASILHDIGYFIKRESHELNTYFMLMEETELELLPYNFKKNLALIAGGHRKNFHDDFYSLTLEEQLKIEKLTSILRISDGLSSIKLGDSFIVDSFLRDDVLIICYNSIFFETAVKRLFKKCDLLKKAYNLNVSLVIN